MGRDVRKRTEILGLIRLEIEHSIYTLMNRKDKKLKDIYMVSDLIIAVYIDDILIIGRNKIVIQNFKDSFRKKFNIKDIRKIQDYLKIEIIRNRAAETLRIN